MPTAVGRFPAVQASYSVFHGPASDSLQVYFTAPNRAVQDGMLAACPTIQLSIFSPEIAFDALSIVIVTTTGSVVPSVQVKPLAISSGLSVAVATYVPAAVARAVPVMV